MYVIVLQDEQQLSYLKHVFESYTRSGLQPQELAAAAHLYAALESRQMIPDPAATGCDDSAPLHVGNARIAEVGPKGVVLDIDPSEREYHPI
jgi:hypothetical protein